LAIECNSSIANFTNRTKEVNIGESF
jgi:hypothetical protein